jgi:hypothetical protein
VILLVRAMSRERDDFFRVAKFSSLGSPLP